MTLTDQQALRLIQDMRANTESAAVAQLLDWIMVRITPPREERAIPAPPAAAGAPSKADRKAHRREYMRLLMQRKRAAARAVRADPGGG
jgi:hypothetical protein